MTAQTQSNVPLLGPLEKVIATTVAVAIIIGIILLLLWRFVFLTIPAGHVGVLFSLLGGGTVKEWVMQEGIAMKWPWNRVFLFEVRTQRIPFEVIALSAEGMTVTIEGAVFFHPKRIDTPEVLTTLGQDYPNRIILPLDPRRHSRTDYPVQLERTLFCRSPELQDKSSRRCGRIRFPGILSLMILC